MQSTPGQGINPREIRTSSKQRATYKQVDKQPLSALHCPSHSFTQPPACQHLIRPTHGLTDCLHISLRTIPVRHASHDARLRRLPTVFQEKDVLPRKTCPQPLILREGLDLI